MPLAAVNVQGKFGKVQGREWKVQGREWKVKGRLNYWLNSDLFRPKKFFFTSNIADFRLSQDFCFRREIQGVTKNCMVLKSAIFMLKKNFLGLNRSEFNQYLSQGIHFLIGVQIEALFHFLCF